MSRLPSPLRIVPSPSRCSGSTCRDNSDRGYNEKVVGEREKWKSPVLVSFMSVFHIDQIGLNISFPINALWERWSTECFGFVTFYFLLP